MKRIKDVTKEFDMGEVMGEDLIVYKCACGKEYKHGYFFINLYDTDDLIVGCESCNRKFFFRECVHVYEVIDDE